MSTKEQQQLMEWRRDKVIMLSSRGLTQSEIARELHVDRSLISRDMTFIRQQAQEHLKTHIQQKMPVEYHKVEVSITQVLKKAWEIVDKTADERIRLQALALIRECNNTKMDMITNGVVVSDALKYVNGRTEKLMAAESSEMSRSDEEEEDGNGDGELQTQMESSNDV